MLLGPGKYSARLRALLLNLLGNSISYRARIAGGGYIYGEEAWIGARATILPGASVGAGAVVAAGSLVRSDVAPNTLVAGTPARLVRKLEPAPSA